MDLLMVYMKQNISVCASSWESRPNKSLNLTRYIGASRLVARRLALH